jgi:hypothetical protein
MRRYSAALLLLACALCAGIAGCSRPAEEAPPVATPTVTISRNDASVGAPVDVTYRFAVAGDAPAFAEKYVVFAHFVDADGELMWVDDHEPPTPTTEWKPGATIEYARTMFIPKVPYEGDVHVIIGLYSLASKERLPMTGTTEGMRAYRVARFRMGLPGDNTFVMFRDGWHDAERATDDAGTEWQWSKKDATLVFRNPKRDVLLYLQLDQPAQALPGPQRVDVRIGGMSIDSFALPTGQRELRKVRLSADQLGSADTVEMTLSVDQTFVPANVPQLRNSDHRELGVRVFRAYVEPQS